MTKTTETSNWRVEVLPRTEVYGIRVNKDDEVHICKRIAEQIKRHCDEVGSISVEYDKKDVCSHCGYSWSEESEIYNGGCCDEDEKNNPKIAA